MMADSITFRSVLFIRNYTLARNVVRVGKAKGPEGDGAEGNNNSNNTDLEKGDDGAEGESEEKQSTTEEGLGGGKADTSDDITMRPTTSSATSLYKEKASTSSGN